jgi:hypothetical protein
VIVQPERMTADQLEMEYDKFNQEFFSIRNMLSRFRHQNLPLRVLPYYVVFNMAYRVPRKAKSRTHWAELG